MSSSIPPVRNSSKEASAGYIESPYPTSKIHNVHDVNKDIFQNTAEFSKTSIGILAGEILQSTTHSPHQN